MATKAEPSDGIEFDNTDLRRLERDDIAVCIYDRLIEETGEFSGIDDFRLLARRALIAAEAFLLESEAFDDGSHS